MVKHLTLLFNTFSSNVAKQVARFCCPFYSSFKIFSSTFCFSFNYPKTGPFSFSPRFALPFYNASVREKTVSGTSVTTVTADDPDRDANAELTYSITHSSSMEYFDINSVTGEVSVKNVFDYEEVQIVNVTITAQDNGVPRLSGSVTLVLFIEDVNDNTPVFERG